MRHTVFLLSLALCMLSCEATRPSLESLRCPTGSATSSPDVPLGSSDVSIFGGSGKDNQFNCNKNPTICASLGTNFSCDAVRGCCMELTLGRCTKSAECSENTSPVCDLTNNICVPCSTTNAGLGEQQCANWNKEQSDPLNRALCISGHCAECRTNSDCVRPGKTFCDQADNICKGCTSNGQCPGSNICKLDASLLATNDTLSSIGECVKATDVAFVNNNFVNCNNGDGTSGSPYCQITQALAAPKPLSYISLKGTGGDMAHMYQAITVNTSGQRVVIIGPGRDVPFTTQQAVINGVTVSGGAQVTLVGLSVTSNTNQPAVQCNGSGILYAQSVLISNQLFTPRGGIYANMCDKVTVEKTKITGTGGYGLYISGGLGHRVINNAFINNGFNPDLHGMRLSGGADGLFAFNTIANNILGVMCDTPATINDSIVAQNLGATQITGCSPQSARNVIGATAVELDPGYKSGGDPTLTTNLINDTCCINKGMPDSNMSIKDDYFSVGRPRGNLYDIGFQEAK